MISRNKDQHKIKIVEDQSKGDASKQKDSTPAKEDKSCTKCFENIRSNNKSAINSISGSKSILSAGEGSITDDGGSNSQIKFQTSNSIWDSEKLSSLSTQPDNKEKTMSEKKDISQKQAEIRQSRVDDMVDGLKNSDTRKDNTVSNVGEYNASSNYRKPQNGMSIFDSEMDFSRVPEKTAGEKASEEVNRPKEKDESWKNGKNISSNSLFNNLFDKLI